MGREPSGRVARARIRIRRGSFASEGHLRAFIFSSTLATFLVGIAPASAQRVTDRSPYVARSAAGTWITVWSSNDTLGGTIGADEDILLSRSTDAGQTWSAPAALDPGAGAETLVDLQPSVATDGMGTWVAAWEARQLSADGTSTLSASLLVSRSTDDGSSWSAPSALLADPGSVARVVTDASGTWMIATGTSLVVSGGGAITWGDPGIFRSTDGGSTWSSFVNLDPGGTVHTAGNMSLATDRAGAWIAAWTSSDGPFGGAFGSDREPVYSRSTDGGLTWSAPAPLKAAPASDASDDRSVRVTYDGLGSWIAGWLSEADGPLPATVVLSRSVDGGLAWGPETTFPLAGSSLVYEGLVLASDGAGRVVAVYSTAGGWFAPGDGDLFFTRSIDGGATWSPAAPLDAGAATDVGYEESWPALVADGAGTWLAVWDSDDYLEGTIGLDQDVLFARSTDDGATWSAPEALNTTAPSATVSDIGVSARKLIVIDKMATTDKAKVVYVSKDTGAAKGPTEDVEAIDGAFTVRYVDDASANGAFVFKNWGQLSSGAPNHWRRNSGGVARYADDSQKHPLEGTTRVAVVKEGRLLKFVAKGLGDRAILDIVTHGAPASGVHTMFFLENGTDAFRHCTLFPSSACVHSAIAGGTGARLICRNGVPATCP
jgi:hypothetical protein